MNNNIIKLLYKYIEDKRIIDEKFVSYMIIELIKEYHLYNEIKIFYIVNDNFSYYDGTKKILAVNLNKEKKLILTFISTLKKFLDIKTYICFINLLLFETIYHEIEHAKQNKIISCSKNYPNVLNKSIEYQIINLSFEHYIKEDTEIEKINLYLSDLEKEYNQQSAYYWCSPDERLAYIKSMNMVYKYAKIITKNSIIIDYIKYKALEKIIDEYEIIDNRVISPLEKYLLIRKCTAIKNGIELIDDKEFINIDEIRNNCSTYKRFLYGLPVCDKEFYCYEKSLKKKKSYHLFNE